MPTYEYACKFCGKHLEIYQPITAEPLKRCPSCKKAGLKRLISGGAGLIFKGTGFYETDYKRSPASAKEAAADKKSSESKSESKTDSKTEAKSAAKTEPPKTSAKPAKT